MMHGASYKRHCRFVAPHLPFCATLGAFGTNGICFVHRMLINKCCIFGKTGPCVMMFSFSPIQVRVFSMCHTNK